MVGRNEIACVCGVEALVIPCKALVFVNVGIQDLRVLEEFPICTGTKFPEVFALVITILERLID